MLNLHTRFLQRLQDNRETRRNICLGLQQVFLHAPCPHYLCAWLCTQRLILCSCSVKDRVWQSVPGLPLHCVTDLGLQGGFARDTSMWKIEAYGSAAVLWTCTQGTDKVKRLHAVVATEAQRYVASMFEVHSEVQQLRDNLREQHRVWTEFYSTVNGVHHSVCCRSFTSDHCMTPYCKAQITCQKSLPCFRSARLCASTTLL